MRARKIGRKAVRVAVDGSLQNHHRCRACGSWNVARSGFKNVFEPLVLFTLGRRPYRCLACGRRFIDRSVSVRGG